MGDTPDPKDPRNQPLLGLQKTSLHPPLSTSEKTLSYMSCLSTPIVGGSVHLFPPVEETPDFFVSECPFPRSLLRS